MHAAEFPLLSVGQFGLLAAQFPPGAGDGHALAGAHADEIGFELGEGGEDIEEHLSHRIARVVEGPAEGQFHVSFPKPIGDGARIWDGPCQPVEFRHDQRVAFAHGGEGLVEAGAGAGRAGEAVIGVDAILGDAQRQERQALGGQILPVGGTARVSDERCRHGGKCTDRVPLPQLLRYHSYETLLVPVWRGSGRPTAPSAGRSPYGQRRACRDERITERNWPDILRVAAALASGVLPPSQLLRKFAAYPRRHELAVTLREIGQVERTLFIVAWLLDADMQRRANTGLNEGEAHHALKNALRIGRHGEIRDRSSEGQHYRMAGLNLLAAIVIYWNSAHLGEAVRQRKHAGLTVEPELLAHISPLGWAHILLTGEYR